MRPTTEYLAYVRWANREPQVPYFTTYPKSDLWIRPKLDPPFTTIGYGTTEYVPSEEWEQDGDDHWEPQNILPQHSPQMGNAEASRKRILLPGNFCDDAAYKLARSIGDRIWRGVPEPKRLNVGADRKPSRYYAPKVR